MSAEPPPLPRAGSSSGRLPAAGGRLGPYVIEHEIGRGGMGAIYRVRHEQTGGVYAVKVILAHRLTGSGDRVFARFKREVEALARVDDHPGIVRVFNFGIEGGHPWCAMEYVPGRALADRLREGPMPPAEAARLVEGIARAVAHAHAQGIVHRDLKPENVLIDEQGRAKVADFGIAHDAFAERLTQTGAMLGSPLYMAPEQVEGHAVGEAVGPATDVYGLGGILYAALTGRAPFEDRQGIGILRATVRDEPAPPSAIAPGVPRALDAVCLRALEKAPADRYADAAALARDLARFLAGEGVEATLSGVASRLWRRYGRRGPALGAGLVAAGLAVAFGLTALAGWWRGLGIGFAGPGDEVRRLERALAEGGRLSEADARLAAALAADANVAADPALARSARLVDGLARLLDGRGEDDADAARAVAAAVRAGGAIDAAALRRAERVLARARRWDALATVLYGAAPPGAVGLEAAPELARALAAAGAEGPFPEEDAAFAALYRARGLGAAERGALLVRRGEAALARGPEGFDAALDAFVRALAEHEVVAGDAGWPEAFHAHARARFEAAVRADEAAAGPMLDLLMRVSGPPLDDAAIARLQGIAVDSGGLLGLNVVERSLAEKLRTVRAISFLERHGGSPMAGRLLRNNASITLGRRWLAEQADAEALRPAAHRNPLVPLLAARVFLQLAYEGELDPAATNERAVRWARAALATGLEQRWIHLRAGRVLDKAGHPAEALELAERALALDRESRERWPVVPQNVAEYLFAVSAAEPGDRLRAVQLTVEAIALQRAVGPRVTRLRAANGFAPWPLNTLDDLAACARLSATELIRLGPTWCCEGGPDGDLPDIEELCAVSEWLEPKRPDSAEAVRAQHRARHPR